MSDPGLSRWPWAVFFVAMLGGAILGRVAETTHVEAAHRIELFTRPSYVSRLDDILVELENCYAAEECVGGATALHLIEGSFEEVSAFWQVATDEFTPWLSDHFRVKTELLRQARETIDTMVTSRTPPPCVRCSTARSGLISRRHSPAPSTKRTANWSTSAPLPESSGGAGRFSSRWR